MNTQELKMALNKAKAELLADGWEHRLSVMHDGKGLAYGSLFVKDGICFYLNKDTLCADTGPSMAECCRPLFN